MAGKGDKGQEKHERYSDPPEKDILDNVKLYEKLIKEFRKAFNISFSIVYNVSAIYEIFRRLDQRIHFYRYFHSSDDEPMYMSDAKRRAVLSYWTIKYKP